MHRLKQLIQQSDAQPSTVDTYLEIPETDDEDDDGCATSSGNAHVSMILDDRLL